MAEPVVNLPRFKAFRIAHGEDCAAQIAPFDRVTSLVNILRQMCGVIFDLHRLPALGAARRWRSEGVDEPSLSAILQKDSSDACMVLVVDGIHLFCGRGSSG